MSVNDNIKFLENIQQELKKKIYWNKYISEIKTNKNTIKKPKNNNLNYLIDTTFRNINRLFVLSFKNDDDGPTRYFFNQYYMLLVRIKDFNALIDNRPFFDQLIKNKQKAY